MKPALAVVFLIAASAAAQSLDERIDRALPSLVTTYQTLHTAPELSTQEANTSALVAAKLRALGYTVTDHIGKYEEPGLVGYGVVAIPQTFFLNAAHHIVKRVFGAVTQADLTAGLTQMR